MVKAVILAALLALTACQTSGGNFCDVAVQLRPSQAQIDAMTDEEVRKHLAYLKRGQKLCGWKP